jgi:hypothetical protein
VWNDIRLIGAKVCGEANCAEDVEQHIYSVSTRYVPPFLL